MQIDLKVHASFDKATVVSVGPTDKEEKAEEKKKKEHSALPNKPSRECECSILYYRLPNNVSLVAYKANGACLSFAIIDISNHVFVFWDKPFASCVCV